MFSLIITIISIALVAALAVATIYYGGSAFSSGSAKAIAATIVSNAQQVTGANVLYANDNSGTYASTISTLVPAYLASQPVPPANGASTYAVSSSNVFTATVANQQICSAIDATVGITSIPTAAPAAATATQYYCYSSTGTGTGATATYDFVYTGG